MANAPTLINLPPPPSDPVTPSEVPSRSGTPNSTTTSMSELSTVAIKDGHRGHLPHHHHDRRSSATSAGGLLHQLDAERADRISRLAGLERVTTARNPTPIGQLTPSAPNPGHSYFDGTGNPAMGRERSTVGSASATGSVGGRTTWAGSDEAGGEEGDKMSESQDMDIDGSSVGGMSDDGVAGSLVAFGEGARTPARQSVYSSSGKGGTPVARDARMIDGISFVGEAGSEGPGGLSGRGTVQGEAKEEAERLIRENMDTTSNDRMYPDAQSGGGGLGKFGFEK
ncbi:hypothetical protein B0A48_06822 [Cryoendolithus antarcticus]|uniref:Uncharacterized protein n=1 Tax=Cryoendolithus antarcticus TaxID=1507870 RepID=A0A1V8T9J8_9PEZI|nr:hypothetical protein B0A48_06822 [Cryoendolithus antarcticus]